MKLNPKIMLRNTEIMKNHPKSRQYPFLYPLKTSENQMFCEVFRGYRNGAMKPVSVHSCPDSHKLVPLKWKGVIKVF